MKKVVLIVVALAGLLAGVIAWRVHVQESALEGDPVANGVVEAESIRVSTRRSARIVELAIEEGEDVEEGQVIARLDCHEPDASLAEIEARIAAAQARAEAMSASVDAQAGQSRAARAAIAVTRARLEALDSQRQLAERQAQRVGELGPFATAERSDQATANAEALAAEAAAVRASASVNRGQAAAAAANAQAAVGQARSAEQEVVALEAMRATALTTVAECVIRAPSAGRLERLYYEVGELLPMGGVVARIVHDDDLRAIVYLANSDFDEAEVGDAARLEADALPNVRFEVTVTRLALEAEFTPRSIQTRSDRDRLVYPVEVRIWDPEAQLRSGMPVTVTFDSPGSGEDRRARGAETEAL